MANKPPKIRRAVITAAGMGTRFLPQTKAMPKEMLPLNNKPIIQYVVEGLVKAGIEQIIIITSTHKRSVEDHFDRNYELEEKLASAGKDTQRQEIIDIANLVEFVYMRQKNGAGNAMPVITARPILGDEPFIVVFPDDFFITNGKPNEYQQLISSYYKTGSPQMALQEAPKSEISNYGVVKIKKQTGRVVDIEGVVEKPPADKAPSNFATVGTYIVTPDMWPYIDDTPLDKSNEKLLPLSFNNYVKQNSVQGVIVDGTFHDTGRPEAYLKAVIDMALNDPVLSTPLRQFLESRL